MTVAVVLAVAVILTSVVLVVSGWTGGRPRLPGGQADDRSRRRDPDLGVWHGDPRPDVVERPAGADAESMDPDDRPGDER